MGTATRERFSSQAAPDVLQAPRQIAENLGRQFQSVLDDALRYYIDRQQKESPQRLQRASMEIHTEMILMLESGTFDIAHLEHGFAVLPYRQPNEGVTGQCPAVLENIFSTATPAAINMMPSTAGKSSFWLKTIQPIIEIYSIKIHVKILFCLSFW